VSKVLIQEAEASWIFNLSFPHRINETHDHAPRQSLFVYAGRLLFDRFWSASFFFLADRRIRVQDNTAMPAIMPARKKSSAITARDASKCEDRNEMETVAAFCTEKVPTMTITITTRIMVTIFSSCRS
jgi:hypothetical protein